MPSGVKSAGTELGAFQSASPPTTKAGLSTSSTAAASPLGSRHDSEVGVAPHFHTAKLASNEAVYLIGGHDTVTGVNNVQYTAQFGNGVSGTIGLDDPTVFNRTALYNLSAGLAANGLTTTAYGGFLVPDLVGNIRVDQAW